MSRNNLHRPLMTLCLIALFIVPSGCGILGTSSKRAGKDFLRTKNKGNFLRSSKSMNVESVFRDEVAVLLFAEKNDTVPNTGFAKPDILKALAWLHEVCASPKFEQLATAKFKSKGKVPFTNLPSPTPRDYCYVAQNRERLLDKALQNSISGVEYIKSWNRYARKDGKARTTRLKTLFSDAKVMDAMGGGGKSARSWIKKRNIKHSDAQKKSLKAKVSAIRADIVTAAAKRKLPNTRTVPAKVQAKTRDYLSKFGRVLKIGSKSKGWRSFKRRGSKPAYREKVGWALVDIGLGSGVCGLLGWHYVENEIDGKHIFNRVVALTDKAANISMGKMGATAVARARPCK